jgi:hypothetical protein
LNAFEAWTWAVAHDEPFIGLGDLFFRCGVERVTLDESAGEVPSLAEQFARRTGRSVQELCEK